MRLRFADFELDVEKRILYRHGLVQRVQPKVLDTLILLVEARGKILTKEELIQALWPNAVVEEGGLARNISILRKLLGEGSATPPIQTIPKRGYRFLLDLSEVSVADPPLSREASPADSTAAPERSSSPAPLPDAGAASAVRTSDRAVRSFRDRVRHPRFLSAVAASLLMVAMAVAIPFLARHDERADAAPSFTANAITTNSYHLPVTAAAVSPDGGLVVYAETGQLHVRVIDTGETHPIPTPTGAVIGSLHWFPDKTQVLMGGFDSTLGKAAVWAISVLGGAPKLLLSDASQPAVSTDGRLIAYQRLPNEVWISHADGSGERLFAKAPPTGWFQPGMQFSPEGESLLTYRYAPGDGYFIETRRLTDGKVRTLFSSKKGIHGYVMVDDKTLLVTETIEDNAVGTRLMSVDLHTREPSTTRILDAPGYAMYSLSADLVGRRVLFVRDKVQSDVYIAKVDEGRSQLSDIRRLTLDDSIDMPSGWFPDGKSVLFHSTRSGRFAIYRQFLDSDSAALLVDEPGESTSATASPDGQHVWYLSRELEPPAANMTPPASFKVQTLTALKPRVLLARAPEYLAVQCAYRHSRCVIVYGVGSEHVFHAFDPETAMTHELLRVPAKIGAHYYWALSPDGERIAIVDPVKADSRIEIFSLAGDDERRVIDVEGSHAFRTIAWDPNGSGFFVTSAIDKNRGALLRVSLQGHATVLRDRGSPRSWALPSPDGKYIAFQEWTNNGNVWMLER